ncbi:MAG TPA: 4-hydroxy-tetrahydrodipicolinate synthase [Deltaproteobacteria bacterium]|nr:4-hydroxy-tetrahydrodipicolinate synthase [Deltaproteobacteria bacterium]
MQRIHSASLMTAIKTPYTSDGELDLDTFDQLAEAQIAAGVEGLIIAGTTGEGHLMDWEEELMLIAHAAHRFGDRLLIVGNTGSNNTREAVRATRFGFSVGMHAALQINPYYGKTSDRGLREHFQRLLDLGPAIIYNVPARTGQDLQPALIEDLAQHSNLLGVKECAGNERMGHYESKGIACWSGNDDQCFEGRHRHGAHGVISVIANVVPGLMRKLMDTNNPALNERLQPLMAWLFHVPSPNALNTLLAMTGAVQPVFRLPYAPVDHAARKQALALLSELDESDWVGNKLNVMDDSDFTLV